MVVAVWAFADIGTALASRAERPRLPLAACIFDSEAERQQCLRAQHALRVAHTAAWRGQHQAQRHVAGCLSTGCHGALIGNPIVGCAWRIVILASGSAEIDQSDRDDFEQDCGRLSDTGRLIARLQAAKIYQAIYLRLMPY